MNEEELLGMILVLRSEMGDSIYHNSFYRFVIVKMFKRDEAATRENNIKSLKSILEMLSARDYE
jgi:hypothetical protein